MKIEKYIEILEKLKSKIIDMTDYKELNYNSRCLAIEKFEYLVTDASYEKICKKLHKEFVKELELDDIVISTVRTYRGGVGYIYDSLENHCCSPEEQRVSWGKKYRFSKSIRGLYRFFRQ